MVQDPQPLCGFMSILVAKVEDPVAVLCGDPNTIISCLDDDKPYEWLDKKLNNVCSTWAINQGLLPLAIKCGNLGLPGLCRTLQAFIDCKLIPETLLEMQLEILLNEAEKMYITSQSCLICI